VDRLAEAVEIAIGQQRDLMFDPITALLVLAIVIAFGVARLVGWKKSTRQRIAEMEDADFPEDDVEAPTESPRPHR
jgi:hypothetical protein